jgi:hypothetical protein
MTLILSGTDGLSDVDGSAATPAIRGTDANTGIFFPAADTIAFSEGGVEAMRLDSGGNMGLGVTPSANAGQSTLNVSNYNRTFSALTLGSNANSAGYIGYNMGNTSTINTWKYITADTGSALYFSGNEMRFMQFATGTAGTTTSGNQAMTLTSAGNLALGNTTSLGSGANRVDLTLNGVSDGAIISFGNGGVRKGYLWNDGTDLAIANESTGVMRFLNSTERMRITSAGEFLVGKTAVGNGDKGATIAPSGEVQVTITTAGGGSQCIFLNRQDATGTAVLIRQANNTVGSISVTASATAYNTSSDYRLKENIAPMTGALAKVALLKPVTYKWKVDGSEGEGFIAHELAEVVSGCVTGEKDAVDAEGNPQYQGIDTSFLVATLTAAIQELKAIVDAQAVEIAALKGTP